MLTQHNQENVPDPLPERGVVWARDYVLNKLDTSTNGIANGNYCSDLQALHVVVPSLRSGTTAQGLQPGSLKTVSSLLFSIDLAVLNEAI